MDATETEAFFTRADGSYVFARWGRPIAPVVFGVESQTLDVIKAALAAVTTLANHPIAETDPELGSNLMVFFFHDWSELAQVPKLDALIPELPTLLTRLEAADANQYRIFRFDKTGAIKAAFVFVRMDEHMSAASADTVALTQAVHTVLLWSDRAFMDRSPLAIMEGTTILRPEIADLIRAAYDPVLPAASQDTSHALRLAARLGRAVQ